MAQVCVERDQWARRRERAIELRDRWPFAAEMLDFYAALAGVQAAGFMRAQSDVPENVAAFAVEHVLPDVVEVSVTKGPPTLMSSVLERFHEADLEGVVERWLRGEELPDVERYLARACAAPVLEALGPRAGAACESPRDERHCPACGGLPGLSFFAASTESLQTAHRYLECSRCATTWPYLRLACAWCGETDGARLAIHSEIGTVQGEFSNEVVKSAASPTREPRMVTFPHVRIDGCKSCSRYVLTINLERDAKAVPLVDELAAIPLTLYANEHGLKKTVPNLMGL